MIAVDAGLADAVVGMAEESGAVGRSDGRADVGASARAVPVGAVVVQAINVHARMQKGAIHASSRLLAIRCGPGAEDPIAIRSSIRMVVSLHVSCSDAHRHQGAHQCDRRERETFQVALAAEVRIGYS